MSSGYTFGPLHLDPDERLLLREGAPVSLTPKAFDLLLHLVRRHGHLVTKQELMEALWPDTFVEEANVTYTVSALRKALGDGQDGERYIQTIPTRGYRFVAPVTEPPGAGGDASSVEAHAPTPDVRRPLMRRPAMALLAIVLLLAVVAGVMALVGGGRTSSGARAIPARLTIPLPDTSLAANWPDIVNVSPDGRHVAIYQTPASPSRRIALRAMTGTEPEELPGTEEVIALVWSPDSRALAFATASAVKVVRFPQRTVETLCNDCRAAGGAAGRGTWSRLGVIIFEGEDGALFAIPEAGGVPTPVTAVEHGQGERRHTAPTFLSDERRVLFFIRHEDHTSAGLAIVDVDPHSLAKVGDGSRVRIGDGTPEHRPHSGVLLPLEVAASYSPGYLFYARDGAIVARPFDEDRVRFTGPPVTLVEDATLTRASFGGLPYYSVAPAGVLVVATIEHPASQFVWVGRTGEQREPVGDAGVFVTFDLSLDGRLAAARFDAGKEGIWVSDLQRGGSSLATFGPRDSDDSGPRWSKDGSLMVNRRPRSMTRLVDVVQLSHANVESRVEGSMGCILDDVSLDGTFILCRFSPFLEATSRGRPYAIWAVPVGSPDDAVLVHEPPAGLIDQVDLSPDSSWVAFNGNDSGRMEVYVVPMQPTGQRWMVSVDGGVQPRWRADGRELFYLGLDGTLYGVEVATRPDGQLAFSKPERLFHTGLVEPSAYVEQYAVSNDGQRFLLLLPVEDRIRRSIDVLLNWPAMVQAASAAP